MLMVRQLKNLGEQMSVHSTNIDSHLDLATWQSNSFLDLDFPQLGYRNFLLCLPQKAGESII